MYWPSTPPKRLKAAGDDDHFEKLLARIRDIRSSKRVFWRKVMDIYATSESAIAETRAVARKRPRTQRKAP